jgi:serpin B
MTRLVLANAIYFKAEWLHQFDPDVTAVAPFHLLDGSTIDVPTMHQQEPYGYMLGDGFRAVELPYENGDVSMLVILPDEGQFQSVEEALPCSGVEIADDLIYAPVTEPSQFLIGVRLNDTSMLSMTDTFGLGEPISRDDRARISYRQCAPQGSSRSAKGSRPPPTWSSWAASALPGEPIVFTVDRRSSS